MLNDLSSRKNIGCQGYYQIVLAKPDTQIPFCLDLYMPVQRKSLT